MVVALIYFAVLLFLIYKTSFFGIIKDNDISAKIFTLLFFLKALAIPVFYFIYQRFYGGIENFDSGNFYRNAKTVNEFARTNFLEYLKMMFGLQDDNEGSYVYNTCLIYTNNWDNGQIRDFFYNDNRIVIRIHSLIHFIAFNSYFVHALFNCFLSFIGIVYLYKALKPFFVNKYIWVLLILCFFPTLWFYTGAVLKEGLTLFFLGCGIYQLNKIALKEYKFSSILFLIFSIFMAFLLKPYVLLFSFMCFALFFKIYYSKKINNKLLVYFTIILIGILGTNVASLLIKNKSLYTVAMARQRVFADASTGGIFLKDSKKFIRLNYDTTLVKKVLKMPNVYTIKLNAAFIYCELSHLQDTLVCYANKDTITQYDLDFKIAKSGSNFKLPNSFLKLSLYSFYYTLAHPLFFNARNSLQFVASLENVIIILSLLIFLIGLIGSKKDKFIPVAMVTVAFFVCYLIGITTPNSGAIVRYRSLVVIFILLSALYYLPNLKKVIKVFFQKN